MKVKVVGLEKQEYTLEDGYSFKGTKIHFLDLSTVRNGLEGHQAKVCRIADESPLATFPLVVDGEYHFFFDDRKHLDYIKDVEY